jgi:hypothetical protein
VYGLFKALVFYEAIQGLIAREHQNGRLYLRFRKVKLVSIGALYGLDGLGIEFR